ncbi:MAG: TGS domain-containing protein [Candidatus Aminicenantes bacterium]|nr:TGS domain-containing protein [Candidatus Aminicenantes bacterium]
MTPWQKEVLKKIKTTIPKYKGFYSNESNLSHYIEVFNILRKKFKDEPLAKAGFLHGIPYDEVRKHFSGLLDEDVIQILRGYESLSALEAPDPDLINNLKVNLIPSLNDNRSILLYIYENLNHMDPDETITKWTHQFSESFSKFPNNNIPLYFVSSLTDKKNAVLLCRVFSKMSELVGLWLERNVFDNLSLWYNNPERFNELISFSERMSENGGLCEKITRIIESELDNIDIESIKWSWHHIASIDREISVNLPKSNWQSNLYRFGYVTSISKNFEDCYKAIFRLHKKFGCRHNQLMDMLWEPTKNGYRAIHTLVHAPSQVRDELKAIPVRIIPSKSDREIKKHINKPDIIIKKFKKNDRCKKEWIISFTPDGRPIKLVAGSRVINFALKLCNRFVAHLRSANINGKRADLLKPLSHGDVVFLDLDDYPRPLPNGWEKKVPKSTINPIKTKFRRYFRPVLIKTGRNYVFEQLMERGIKEEIPAAELDSWVETTINEMLSREILPRYEGKSLHIHNWWYFQLGILVSTNRGENYYYIKKVDENLAKLFIINLLNTIKSSQKYELDFSDGSLNLNGKFDYCPKCDPSIENEVKATYRKGRMIFHRVDAPCAKGGKRVSRPLIASQPQYFVIETNNRVGVVVDILTIFRRYEIDLLEVMARQFGFARAVIRLQMKNIDKGRIETIYNEIYQLNGVIQVLKPNDTPQPILEISFPRRSLHFLHKPQFAPYITGPPLENDDYFYGMQKELDELGNLFKNACMKGNSSGIGAFIHGPKRVGKSSLVKYFLRQVDDTSYPNRMTFYVEASRGAPWSAGRIKIKKNLIERAHAIARANGKELPILKKFKIESILDIIQEKLNIPIILVIDEMVGLIKESYRAGEDKRILKFCDDILSKPNRLICWVGPEAPSRKLPPSLMQIFERSEYIKVHPLNFEDTFKLLKAEKLAPQYSIEVYKSVARSVFRETSGHPYHISLLAKSMWKLGYRPERNKTTFTKELLFKAISETIPNDISFLSVNRIINGIDNEIENEILRLLTHSHFDKKGMTKEMLQDELRNRGKRITLRRIITSLDYLNAVGVINFLLTEQNQYWQIFSPLLEKYLKSKLSP